MAERSCFFFCVGLVLAPLAFASMPSVLVDATVVVVMAAFPRTHMDHTNTSVVMAKGMAKGIQPVTYGVVKMSNPGVEPNGKMYMTFKG